VKYDVSAGAAGAEPANQTHGANLMPSLMCREPARPRAVGVFMPQESRPQRDPMKYAYRIYGKRVFCGLEIFQDLRVFTDLRFSPEIRLLHEIRLSPGIRFCLEKRVSCLVGSY